ncbi:MAG: HYR domain-containing protein, partial [Chloroflexota bacterium]|nr:HYR domain-containing protein [Chloroflexota bacterium]
MPRRPARPPLVRRLLAAWVTMSLLALAIGVAPALAATVGQFPSSNAPDLGSWVNPELAYADDGAHATVSVAKNSTVARIYGNFGFDAVIPSGATITSVTVELQYRTSVTNGDDSVRAQPYVTGSTKGTQAAGGPAGGDTTISATSTGVFSRSDLLDGTFTVRVSNQRGSPGAPNHTFLVDYVKVTVVYADLDTTPPVVTVPADITTEATGPSGAVVTYSASATDDVDGTLTPTCVPASGSTFPLGATTVT